MRDPGHCFTTFAETAPSGYAPDAVWTFAHKSDAEDWRRYLKNENRDMVCRIFDRTIRVSGVTIVVYCLVIR